MINRRPCAKSTVQKPVSPYGNTASPGKHDLLRSRYDAVLLFIKIAHDPIDVNPFLPWLRRRNASAGGRNSRGAAVRQPADFQNCAIEFFAKIQPFSKNPRKSQKSAVNAVVISFQLRIITTIALLRISRGTFYLLKCCISRVFARRNAKNRANEN